MALPHDHYRSREPSPLSVKLAKYGSWIAAPLLALALTRGSAGAVQPVNTARIHCFQAGEKLNGTLSGTGFKQLFARTTNAVAYFDAAGRRAHLRIFKTNERYSGDRFGYALYRRTGTEIQLYNRSGKLLARHKSAAYPRAVNSPEYYFLFAGDQTGIALLRKNGHISGRWHHFSSMVTAWGCNSAGKRIGIGLIDGAAELINLSDGKTVWRRKFSRSKIPFIKAAALNSDNRMLLLSGLDPEQLSLIDPDGSVAWQTTTGGKLSEPMQIFAGKRFCAAHDGKRGYLLDTGNGAVRGVTRPVLDSAKQISHASYSESTRTGLALLGFNRGDTSEVLLLNDNGRILFSRTFPSRWAFTRFSQTGQGFYIQTEQRLYIYRLMLPENN